MLETLLPLPEEQVKRRALLEKLTKIVHARWPEAAVKVYGSGASHLALKNADMDSTMVFQDAAVWARVELEAEEMEFSDDESYDFQYSKGARTKPTDGRNAAGQWQQRDEKRKKKRQEKAKERAEKAEAEGDDAAITAAEEETAAEEAAAAEAAEKEREKAEKAKQVDVWGGAGNVIVRLGRDLFKAGLRDVKPLPKARVPVVKFKDEESGMSCDVCLNNTLATENTRLLYVYSRIDPRVREMVILVKYWAKQRGVNTPYHGTLSSYAYVLLVIFYLQTRPNPVVPVLQDLRPPKSTRRGGPMIDGHDCYFCDNLEYIESLGFGTRTRNNESLGQLLVGFFGYFATGFSYKDSVISIRTGQVLQKSDKEWTAKQNSRRDRYWWCIEDPFELTHNLGRVADRDSLYTMRGEFIRAHKLLNRGHGPYTHSSTAASSLAKACERFEQGSKR